MKLQKINFFYYQNTEKKAKKEEEKVFPFSDKENGVEEKEK